jgi:exodeoxyribonuclease-3
MAARVGDVTAISVYVINGQVTGSPAYVAKLQWLKAFRSWLDVTFEPSEPLVIAGDFNVCSDERDLWDPAGWEGHCHFTDPERAEVRALTGWGLTDLFRIHTPDGGHFSWWDYRAGAFHKRMGLRIDLMFATEPLASRCREVRIDRNERRPKAGPGAPSDHAPVIADFDD